MNSRGKTPGTRRAAAAPAGSRDEPVRVRAVRRADLPDVIALDATVTGLHKADYWQRVYRRYGIGGQGLRHFLVAVEGARVVVHDPVTGAVAWSKRPFAASRIRA